MRFSWSRCLWLTDAWDCGNGFSSVDGVICLVHFCLTLGSCGYGLILVVLFRLVVCWFHLIRELWSGGGLLIVPWFCRFGGVIHWLIIGQSWIELDWGDRDCFDGFDCWFSWGGEWWLGWDGFVCVMSDSISDLVVGNRDWSGGCPFVSIKGWFDGGDSGLLVRVTCELWWIGGLVMVDDF